MRRSAMDSKTFDAITKRLGSGTDRRRVLAGLVGGAFSALLGHRGEAQAIGEVQALTAQEASRP